MRLPLPAVLLVAAAAALAALPFSPARPSQATAAPQPPRLTESVAPEMEEKVTCATKVVSGLAREDFALVREGAVEWRRLSENASWHRNRSQVYMSYAREFERACDRVIEAADQQSTERVAFAYMQATVACVACHSHVRNTVQVSPRTGFSSEKSDTRGSRLERGTVIR